MAKNRYDNKPETESNTTPTTPELKEIIGEDGMVDATTADNVETDEIVNTANVDSTNIVEDENQMDPINDEKLGEVDTVTDSADTETKEDGTIPPSDLPNPDGSAVNSTPEETVEKPQPLATFEAGHNVLNDAEVSIEDKIRWCLTEAPNVIKNIAIQLEAYNETMKPSAIYNESKMLNKQYELVSIFRSIFDTEEYANFKVKFDVLNLFFAYYKNEAFSPERLSRFDYLWKWSANELTTLLHMVEVVSQLCIYSERVKRLKQINLDMSLDSTKTIVTETARNNIIRYYKI